MSVYNTAEYLDEAIQSVLSQSFADFEFIISDDWSNDKSKEIIQKYVKQDQRIIFLDNKINRGIIANLNDCMKIASWEFIAIMESDDISLPQRFQNQIDHFYKNKSTVLLGCWSEMIDKKGDTISFWKTETEYKKIKSCYLYKFQFCTPWIMFKKYIYQKMWSFQNGIVWDNYLYTFAILEWMIVENIGKVLIKKRNIETSLSAGKFIKVYNKWASMNIWMLWKYEIKNPIPYILISYKWIFSVIYYIYTTLLKKMWFYETLSFLWRKFILKNVANSR